jgi:hypothetical protein
LVNMLAPKMVNMKAILSRNRTIYAPKNKWNYVSAKFRLFSLKMSKSPKIVITNNIDSCFVYLKREQSHWQCHRYLRSMVNVHVCVMLLLYIHV